MPDLNTIPGIPQLWTHTQGNPRITIAILDGPTDMERACFVGANFTQIKPYWAEDIEINDEYLHYVNLYLEFEKQQKAKKDDTDHDKDEAKKEQKAFFEAFPKPIRERVELSRHATHISSTILGQHGTPAPGIAPHCTAINIPIAYDVDNFISPVNLTHAINAALKAGANIIHIAACHPTQTGVSHDMFARAVKQCQDHNILIVAPAGNDKGECWCIPAILPGVLTVGAMRDDGQPFKFSNYGGDYQTKGVMAYGEHILGAQPGTDEPMRQKGTSCAAPIVTGICALLMSLQLQRGEQPNAKAVRTAILQSAIPCDPQEVEEPERCLAGKLNIPAAYQLLTGQPLLSIQPTQPVRPQIILPTNELPLPARSAPAVTTSSEPLNQIHTTATQLVTASATTFADISPAPPASERASLAPSTVTPSAVSNTVYALGTLGYDFGTEARRDTFKQLMPAVSIDGVLIPANPYDIRQMVNYLELSPVEGKSLIWTLNQELTPIYALEPQRAFASEIYAVFQMLLAGQIQPESSDDYIERVSIPGNLTNRTVELFSGQVLPVLALPNIRGMYGWQANALVEAAVATVSPELSAADSVRVQRSLKSFLHRIYYDRRNLGQLDRDRALNFAATNTFQAASTFAEAIVSGMELESIEIEKSPLCRLNSNCWDVKLKFIDAENSRRAKKVYRFTIDVASLMPVTLGAVRSWSVPR